MSFVHSLPTPRLIPRQRGDTHGDQRVFLVPAGDGWALVGGDGRMIVRGAGTSGRRRCLEYARANGILTVLS